MHGMQVEAKQDMQLLGLSLVTGGGPMERISSAWKAFHANRRHLTSRRLSKRTRWDLWLMYVGSVLAYECWGRVWNSEIRTRIDHTVHCIVRAIIGGHPEEGETWLDWHLRTIRTARQSVRDLHGRMFAQTLLNQAKNAWMRWLGKIHAPCWGDY